MLKMASRSRRSEVLSAINSLANDRIVCLTNKDKVQFEAVVQDFFDCTGGSDDDSSDSDDESGNIPKYSPLVNYYYPYRVTAKQTKQRKQQSRVAPPNDQQESDYNSDQGK